MAVCTGCSPDRHEETDQKTGKAGGSEQEETAEESEDLAEGYREIYEQAAEQGLLDSSELEAGYYRLSWQNGICGGMMRRIR